MTDYICPTCGARFPYKEMLIGHRMICKGVRDDWSPTTEAINALPEPLRRYIHDLETQSDPAGMVAENILLKEQIKALVKKIKEMGEEQ